MSCWYFYGIPNYYQYLKSTGTVPKIILLVINLVSKKYLLILLFTFCSVLTKMPPNVAKLAHDKTMF